MKKYGANIATADERPGQDGLTGINLRYNLRVNGECTRIGAFLKNVETNGGEVYEFADAQADRQKRAGSDRSTGYNYGLEQSPEITM